MGDLLDSALIEVAIGMVVIWFAAATITATITEVIAGLFHFRSNNLWRYLSRVLTTAKKDERIGAIKDATVLGANPLKALSSLDQEPLKVFTEQIAGLGTDLTKWPAVDNIARSDAVAALVSAMRNPTFENTSAGKSLPKLAVSAVPTEAQLEAAGKWFDDHMQLASAAYRRAIRKWSALVGVFVIAFLGLDSIGLAERLYREPETRRLTSTVADKITDGTRATDPSCRFLTPSTSASSTTSSTTTTLTKTTTAPSTTTTTEKVTTLSDGRKCIEAVTKALVPIKLSIWQDQDDRSICDRLWPRGLLGLIFSTIAVGAGAPFWFAILKRLMAVRPTKAE